MGAFRSIYWGFLLTMLDFRIGGFDILPDILGFIFFAVGIKALLAESEHFKQAGKFNLAMIFLSLFSLYQRPAEPPAAVPPFNFDFWGLLAGYLLGIIVIIVTWHLVYHLFMGIGELASRAGHSGLEEEAAKRWEQYKELLVFTIIAFFLITVPLLGIVVAIGLLIASIILCINILKFLKKCEEHLQG